MRRQRHQPRSDRFEDELVRLGGDILERRRTREHRTGALADFTFGRDLRKVHLAEHVGCTVVGVGQLGMKLCEPSCTKHGRDRCGDPLGVEALGDLGRGASDDLGPEPAAVLHDLDRGRLQVPDNTRKAEEPEQVERRIELPPAKSLADAALECVVVVVPAFAHREDREEPVVAGMVAGDIAPPSDTCASELMQNVAW